MFNGSTPDTPISEMLLEPLLHMQGLAQTLFRSLSPLSTRPPPPPATSLFIECDVALAAAVRQARVHQIKQKEIEELKAEVLELDGQLMDLWGELEFGKQELEAVVDEGKERLEAIERARTGDEL
jgi:mediator of RNA polymerase II transcription subunit 4